MTMNPSMPHDAISGAVKHSIRKADFGTTPEGEQVEVYTLTNPHGLEARIMNFGAILLSLLVPDKDGKLDDIVLGFESLDPYFVNEPHFGAIIGRYANRIAKGKFWLDGSEYILAKNNGPNTLHGGVKGFDKVLWQATSAEIENGVALSLRYTSKDGEEGFPGNLDVQVVYTLTDTDELSIDYQATTDKATPVNLTSHSYFNLAGRQSPSALAHEIYINADRFTPVDGNLIPTSESRPVEGTPLDFRMSTPLGARIGEPYEQLLLARGYDHNFILNRRGSGLELAARVHEPITGRILEIETTEPAMQLYSGNFLNGTLTGKQGRVYQQRAAVCFETQHFPDSPNQAAFPSTILRPGEKYHSKTVQRFFAESR